MLSRITLVIYLVCFIDICRKIDSTHTIIFWLYILVFMTYCKKKYIFHFSLFFFSFVQIKYVTVSIVYVWFMPSLSFFMSMIYFLIISRDVFATIYIYIFELIPCWYFLGPTRHTHTHTQHCRCVCARAYGDVYVCIFVSIYHFIVTIIIRVYTINLINPMYCPNYFEKNVQYI